MKKILFFVLMQVALLFSSCNQRGTDYSETKKIVLSPEDNTEYISFIESIEVLNLSVDEDWIHISYPKTYVSDSVCVFFNKESYLLICYNIDGHKLFSRNLRGRGYGECINVGNIYVRSDSIFVYDQVYSCINVYDLKGQTIDVISTNEIYADEVFPISGGYVGVSIEGTSGTDKYYVAFYDNDFNLRNKLLKLPKYIYGWNQRSGHSSLVNIYNDSLRFMLPMDYNYYSASENGIECIYQLDADNPIPINELENRDDVMDVMIQIVTNGYASLFERLFETNRFVSFRYSVNGGLYSVLIDKTTGKSYSLSNPQILDTENPTSLVDNVEIWKHVVHSATSLFTDGVYIYASTGYSLFETLDCYKRQLDGILLDLYKQMYIYVQGNSLDENDKIFVKIKLKG